MTHTRSRCYMLLLGLGMAVACEAVTATRGAIVKQDAELDPQGIWLENKVVKIGITTNKFAGQVMSFVYKPTGHELGAEAHPQGFSMDRMGEDRYFWKAPKSEGFAGEIKSQSDAKAEARVSYVWNYNHNNIRTRIGVSKTYRLSKGSSALHIAWRLENLGEQAAMMTPWVKQLGGQTKEVLCGPTLMLFPEGPRDPKSEFVQPTTDWVARLSGAKTTDALPMVCSTMDYTKIFQQFPWRGKVRFTLETVLSRIELKPGKSWEVTYVLAAMPNLGQPLYVAPELAAEAELKEGKIEVRIAAAETLGERRIEGEINTPEGRLVAKLPNRQVDLVPGSIGTLTYPFAPPGDGVYLLSLSVFDEAQKIVRLGAAVNSQQPSITLPVAVGPKPQVLVRKWQSGGFSWPRRQPREVTPLRVVLASNALKAVQVRVPDRVFPEDRFVYGGQPEPAAIRLARGEYEDIQLAVEFAQEEDVTALDITLALPKHPDGAVLKATVREVVYLTTETPSSYKNFPVGEYPDPLFPLGWERQIPAAPVAKRNLAAMRRAKRRVFWIICRAERDAPPGLYKGALALDLPGGRHTSIPLAVEVWDFALPKRAALRCSTGMVGFSPKRWANNMRTMGLDAEAIEALKNEKSLFDRFRELTLSYGWTPTMWFGPKEWQRYYDFGRGVSVFPCGRKNPEAEAWLKEKGLLRYAFCYAPFDEHADVKVPEVVAWARRWKAETDIPILDCFYGRNVEPLFGLVDIWLGQSPTQAWAKERKKHGDQFFSCNSPLIWYVEFEPVTGRAAFWRDFVTGVDGRYVYSSGRWTDDVYKKNYTSGNYMGCAIYPSPDGLCTSIRFETMRDGVEDYDYLAILRDAVAATPDGEADAAAVRAARGLLTDQGLAARITDVGALRQLRTRIAQLIVALAKQAAPAK